MMDYETFGNYVSEMTDDEIATVLLEDGADLPEQYIDFAKFVLRIRKKCRAMLKKKNEDYVRRFEECELTPEEIERLGPVRSLEYCDRQCAKLLGQ